MALPPKAPDAERDAAIAFAIEQWFAAHARDLTWRRTVATINGVPTRDPYHSLVSELMLQQTQVSRVIDRYNQFIARFPTVQDLARADEADVLALWSGLGYYRRARLLHAAARHVADTLNAVFPTDLASLRSLPGVGPYTAGAIASMALGQRVPLVDGNVARVLLRLDGASGPMAQTGNKTAERWAWSRAADLVATARGPGAFNEGMMELGALVCTPAAPQCHACPVATRCRAFAAGTQELIPAPRQAIARSSLYCAAVVIHDARGRVAIEQRSATGMWAGLWQAPTLERPDRAPRRAELLRWLGSPRDPGQRLERAESFAHNTTHREVAFDVWRWRGTPPAPERWTWHHPDNLDSIALSSAQRRVLSTPPTPQKSRKAARGPSRSGRVGTGATAAPSPAVES